MMTQSVCVCVCDGKKEEKFKTKLKYLYTRAHLRSVVQSLAFNNFDNSIQYSNLVHLILLLCTVFIRWNWVIDINGNGNMRIEMIQVIIFTNCAVPIVINILCYVHYKNCSTVIQNAHMIHEASAVVKCNKNECNIYYMI